MSENRSPTPTRRTLLASAAILSATGVTAVARDDAYAPIEGNKGGTILGPTNLARAQQNPDLLRPPETDHGDVPESALRLCRRPYENPRRRLVAPSHAT